MLQRISNTSYPNYLDNLEELQAAAKVSSAVLNLLMLSAKEGVSLANLDSMAEEFIRDSGATPSFKTMYGYSWSTCLSVNEKIVHGIPTKYVLKYGDVLSIDTGAHLNGYHSDNARTIEIGSKAHEELIESGKQAFEAALHSLSKSNLTGDLGSSIHKKIMSFLDEKNRPKYKIFYKFQGHGIGKELHELPLIPNMGFPGKGTEIVPGTSFCIEPIVLYRSSEVMSEDSEHAEVSQFFTSDGLPSSHYECHVYMTASGPIILTDTAI